MRYARLAFQWALVALAVASLALGVFIAVRWRASYIPPGVAARRFESERRSKDTLTSRTLLVQMRDGRLCVAYTALSESALPPPDSPAARQTAALLRYTRDFFVDRWWLIDAKLLQQPLQSNERMTTWRGFTVFGAEWDAPNLRIWHRGLRAPAWSLVVATALPPLWLTGRLLLAWRRRRRRRMEGHCPACGYDLRATPDRCPECGREVAKA